MGRLDTPKKPTGSSQDPATSAKAAAARELQTTISNRHAAASPNIPTPHQVKQSIRFLNARESETILHKVIDQSPEARAIIQAYFDTPVGSAEKPFDFDALRSECLMQAEFFDGEEWEGINGEYYEDEKQECMRDVRKTFDSAILRLREVSIASTSTIATKMLGLHHLFSLVDLMRDLPDLQGETGHSWCEVDHQMQLVATAYDAIEETIQALTPSRKAQSSELSFPKFDGFVKRCEELAPLVEGVDREWDEN